MKDDYKKAKRLGDAEVRRAAANQEVPYVAVLDNILTGYRIAGEELVGTVDIPLDFVAGTRTTGRQNAFSRGYLPLLDADSEFAQKWSNLYDIQIEEGLRDPVRVYEFLHRFYVQEGNKRVSVMRYLGSPAIRAEVTRILPAWSEKPEIRLYYEFLSFYKKVPLYEVECGKSGNYDKLLRHFGNRSDKVWSEEEIRSLRSSYRLFKRTYLEHGGDQLDLCVGDALLCYLRIYPAESIPELSPAVLKKRIEKIWGELLLESRTEKVAYLETPGEQNRAFLSVMKYAVTGTEDRVRAAFIYEKNTAVSGWARAHEMGRLHIEKTFGDLVTTEKFENCGTTDELFDAVNRAAENGADLVFTTSPLQMNATMRMAIHYPQIHFLNCSVDVPHKAVRCYSSRMYEAKFLLGALAAALSEDHVIGYRADYPLFGALASINAFALGAQLIDPKARVHLRWMFEEKEDWKETFRKRGIRIISGYDTPRRGTEARESGLFEMQENGKIRPIAAAVWDFSRYYEILIDSYLKGNWKKTGAGTEEMAVNYWYGMSAGVIDVILSQKLPEMTKKLIRTLRRGIISGAVDPFSGYIESRDGVIREDGDLPLTMQEIIQMDWLCSNVDGTLPDLKQMTAKLLDDGKLPVREF